MADRTTTRTKRGGARRNAGRPRVHTPGKQNSLCLGTGDKPARVLKLFREERNRRSFKHNHEFLDYLLRQLGTAQQDFVPVTTSFIQPGANEGYPDTETDFDLEKFLASFQDVAVSGELFPGPCDPMDYVPQFEATGVGSNSSPGQHIWLQASTFDFQQAVEILPSTSPTCVQGLAGNPLLSTVNGPVAVPQFGPHEMGSELSPESMETSPISLAGFPEGSEFGGQLSTFELQCAADCLQGADSDGLLSTFESLILPQLNEPTYQHW